MQSKDEMSLDCTKPNGAATPSSDDQKPVYGLLGKGLSHSLSPALHSLIGNYTYELFDVDEDQARDFIQAKDFAGINVTIPYKELAFALSDIQSEACASIQAANTLTTQESVSTANNTDYHGFRELLKTFLAKEHKLELDDIHGKKILVLGSGGASKAVQAVLSDLQAKVVVISRKGPHTYTELEDGTHKDAFLLVNTTPVGMSPHAPAAPISRDTLAKLEGLEGIIDLIYNPHTTLLGFWAEELTIAYTSGMLMLVEQGIKSARLFGAISEDEVVDAQEIAQKLLSQSRNIVLIGMPSAGKTSCGRELSKIMGRPVVDTDELFEQKHGLTPAKYLETHGEDAFRDLEAQIVREVSNLKGYVICCGGGVVCREENYYALRQNSEVVYIKRPLEELVCTSRPLSKDQGIQKLYELRKDQYERFATLIIDSENTVFETTNKIAAHLTI